MASGPCNSQRYWSGVGLILKAWWSPPALPMPDARKPPVKDGMIRGEIDTTRKCGQPY